MLFFCPRLYGAFIKYENRTAFKEYYLKVKPKYLLLNTVVQHPRYICFIIPPEGMKRYEVLLILFNSPVMKLYVSPVRTNSGTYKDHARVG